MDVRPSKSPEHLASRIPAFSSSDPEPKDGLAHVDGNKQELCIEKHPWDWDPHFLTFTSPNSPCQSLESVT